ncbi:helix-turn-helix domain-containing protein [Streptomyces sp. NPDC023327]|uniref:helix-turn-helix domain-containing protein n=1 Tax=Streptomyces sp. NPDC023327 TaxID=3157088 RepID=UPI0033C519B2
MDSLAELLRELKERSGFSYGVLAKRLHMSTSTLHRYCNGDAVPVDYAPVERFARLCKASPEELVEVHRRWILADAARGQKAGPRGGAAAVPPSVSAPQDEPDAAPAPESEPAAPEPASEARPAAEPGTPEAESAAAPGVSDQPVGGGRRRMAAMAAAVAAVVGIGSVALALSADDDGGHRRAEGATAPASTLPRAEDAKGEEREDRGEVEKDKDKPSAPPSRKEGRDGPKPDASREGGAGRDHTSSAGGTQNTDLVEPLTARTKPYVYEDACTQHFLVDRKPGEVPQPPPEQDAPAWVADLGAVSSGEQFIEVTVQGAGEETVVLQDMDVRVQSTSAPLAWNDYAMETGCGGNVSTKSFGVDLDDAAPRTEPRAGQRDFPYKVSENDPEVFYIKAATKAHDVRWYLELRWSSGKRHGTLRVDDQGRPFRTSGREGRTTYGWPLGSTKWGRQPG